MQSIVLFLAAATMIGASAALLVSKDLAAKAGLVGMPRYVLATGLSLGVISVGMKSMIALAVSANMSQFHAALGEQKTANPLLFERPFSPDHGRRPWRALERAPKAPATNYGTPERVALGRKLFHDVRLSADRKVSCASCHQLRHGGDDDRSTSVGIKGLTGERNAPTVVNAAYLSRLFWDGRAVSLEDQAKGPFINAVEMGMASLDAVAAVVNADPEYRRLFVSAYGEGASVDIDRIAQAIASYERTLVSRNTAYDRFIRGEINALTAQQQYGMYLFNEVGCRSCHVDPTFSARDVGVYRAFPVFSDDPIVQRFDFLADTGRSQGGDSAQARGLWRVPSLRNVEHTAPYFHNGAVDTLQEAVRVMAAAQLNYTITEAEASPPAVIWDRSSQSFSVEAQSDRRSGTLGPNEIDALVAFLRSLSVSYEDLETNSQYSDENATPLQ